MFTKDVDYDEISLRLYRLLLEQSTDAGFLPPNAIPVQTKFGLFSTSGLLTLYPGFVYDGATGAVDTPEVMLAAAFHDWGCEAVNNGDLPKEYRRLFDNLFYKLLKENGLDETRWEKFRASYMHFAVTKWGNIKHG